LNTWPLHTGGLDVDREFDGMTTERFLTRPEAAALMRLDPRTLGNLAAAGDGPPYLKTARLRGKALYRESDVIAYLERNGRRGQPVTSSTGTGTTSSSARAKSPRRRKSTSKG
jgi:hypothetical protein